MFISYIESKVPVIKSQLEICIYDTPDFDSTVAKIFLNAYLYPQ